MYVLNFLIKIGKNNSYIGSYNPHNAMYVAIVIKNILNQNNQMLTLPTSKFKYQILNSYIAT